MLFEIKVTSKSTNGQTYQISNEAKRNVNMWIAITKLRAETSQYFPQGTDLTTAVTFKSKYKGAISP